MKNHREKVFLFLSLSVGLVFLTACQTSSKRSSEWALTKSEGYREGKTMGAPVSLDLNPVSFEEDFKTEDEKNLCKKFVRDREAILRMIGTYKVNFEFIELFSHQSDDKMDQNYRSWGTEYVFALKDEPHFISLQHVMVMFFQKNDGSIEGPKVMKHWRQDWSYETDSFHQYAGNKLWKEKKLSREEVAGKWLQRVYQVDDSPRYSALGLWHHMGQNSEWVSEKFWRPLPRREASVRSDYHVMEGIHRITILPDGWVQQQNNKKMVLGEKGGDFRVTHSLATETGVSRYRRLKDFDVSSALEYWRLTKDYWLALHETWREIHQKHSTFRIRPAKHAKQMYEYLFGLAQKYHDAATTERRKMLADLGQRTIMMFIQTPETHPELRLPAHASEGD